MDSAQQLTQQYASTLHISKDAGLFVAVKG
jgi:hypothetical protein